MKNDKQFSYLGKNHSTSVQGTALGVRIDALLNVKAYGSCIAGQRKHGWANPASHYITHNTAAFTSTAEYPTISLQVGYERSNPRGTLAGQADTDKMGNVALGEDAKTGTQIRPAMQENESTSHWAVGAMPPRTPNSTKTR
ncbi:hypothetical protein BM1_04898 [Bipolaris maydis]|nr:hypothetical protein BM1_04898 [Bipolaris maydis]